MQFALTLNYNLSYFVLAYHSNNNYINLKHNNDLILKNANLKNTIFYVK